VTDAIPTAYLERFQRVLDHIDAHLGENLDTTTLSGIAAFSKFHFNRQFSALLGMGPARYVQQQRMRRAAHQLAYRDPLPILEIALQNGYESPEAFARAFKQEFGQTPSDFRRTPPPDGWLKTNPSLTMREALTMTPARNSVEIIQFQATPIALLDHVGDPATIGESLRRFIAWRKANALPPSRSATFNLFYEDPAALPPEDFRLGIAAATSKPVEPNSAGVIGSTIPAGRCARLRHHGSDDLLEASISWLYGTWLPGSGETVRDAPLFLQRITLYPDMPENEAIADIHLPLAERAGDPQP
tara:strand:- start:2234 stop:3136 length:903 start_codon:yes stop_codon:yes gene_type:complete